MFEKFRKNQAVHRLIEEQLYEQALAELDSGQLRSGLWAKALADSSGDEQKVRGLYLKYRVQAMKDEAELASGFLAKAKEETHHQVPEKAKQKNKEAVSPRVPDKIARKDNDDVNPLHISNYRPLSEFSRHMRTPEDVLIGMIREGVYQGRLFDKKWYVHRSEFSQ